MRTDSLGSPLRSLPFQAVSISESAVRPNSPVIASRIGGMPELIPEDAGVLVPPGDVAALRDALRGVMDGTRLGGALEPLPLETVADHAAKLEVLYGGA